MWADCLNVLVCSFLVFLLSSGKQFFFFVCVSVCQCVSMSVCVCARAGNSPQPTQRFLVEYTKTTGAIATSEQAMPLPRDSQPSPREIRAVHTADIHITFPNPMARTFG